MDREKVIEKFKGLSEREQELVVYFLCLFGSVMHAEEKEQSKAACAGEMHRRQENARELINSNFAEDGEIALNYETGQTSAQKREMPLEMNFGKKLRELRGKETQKRIAEGIGIKKSTYAMYERGERVPRDETKVKIARYFGKDVQEIFFT